LQGEIHAFRRRPFYRVYPGVTAETLRIDIGKIDISKVHPPVNGLALEFAERGGNVNFPASRVCGDHFRRPTVAAESVRRLVDPEKTEAKKN